VRGPRQRDTKTQKKRTPFSSDFAQSAAVLSVVLGRPLSQLMSRFTLAPPRPLDESLSREYF
jgi:hypothetical protein